MAAIQDKALVTVKAINAKLAKQIEVLNYDWREQSKYRELWWELQKGADAGGSVRVLGWATYEAVVGPTSMKRARFWLVRYKAQLWWWAAPDETSDIWAYHNPGLEQLFLG